MFSRFFLLGNTIFETLCGSLWAIGSSTIFAKIAPPGMESVDVAPGRDPELAAQPSYTASSDDVHGAVVSRILLLDPASSAESRSQVSKRMGRSTAENGPYPDHVSDTHAATLPPGT